MTVLKADFLLANPTFNGADRRGEPLKNDKRAAYGVPHGDYANLILGHRFIHNLSPTGLARYVLANISMSSTQSGKKEACQDNLEESDNVALQFEIKAKTT